jgi:hypothetical protein
MMGIELAKVVDYVRRKSKGAAVVDLARLNLLVGRAISRNAMSLPDEPEIVERAWFHAYAILGEPHPAGAQ